MNILISRNDGSTIRPLVKGGYFATWSGENEDLHHEECSIEMLTRYLDNKALFAVQAGRINFKIAVANAILPERVILGLHEVREFSFYDLIPNGGIKKEAIFEMKRLRRELKTMRRLEKIGEWENIFGAFGLKMPPHDDGNWNDEAIARLAPMILELHYDILCGDDETYIPKNPRTTRSKRWVVSRHNSPKTA